MNKKIQGKKNRASGQRFELKVRKDLEGKGWVVSKWMNNVEFSTTNFHAAFIKLVPAKHKFRGKGIPMAIGTGFPDFIAYALYEVPKNIKEFGFINEYEFGEDNVIGVECKSNGYLDKEEKEKCRWLLDNNIFSKILIAKKGKKRGEIIYEDYMGG
ncbi:MAG: hypothetical protein ACTSR8_22445 [Promethearchaeota archaeon]